ncbi:MAG: uncharacterized protein JWN04_3549 [Myxococcaceae bacterium]|nr:uncharacterized protein [Myxococcaceae bacterium]
MLYGRKMGRDSLKRVRETALLERQACASSHAKSAIPSSERLVPAWYRARLRPLLCTHAPDVVTLLDASMAKARPGDGRFTELRVGIIGEAGVGKSTLINALISERLPILPQGGVGPLTAAPIEVRHASQPYVRVTCLGSSRVRQLIDAVATNSLAPQFQDADRVRLRALRQLARLLVGASQFAELEAPTMLAFLFSCLSGEVDERVPSSYFERLLAAQSVVALGDCEVTTREVVAGVDLPSMLSTLAEHAAGYLAPLTSSLEVGWDADLLRDDIVLVDLPGLGVANDQYRSRTSTALQSLDALLWVVDRSGLTQSSADLLQSTQFLFRMIEEGRQRRPATLELLIAVTKLDQPVPTRCSRVSSRGPSVSAGVTPPQRVSRALKKY